MYKFAATILAVNIQAQKELQNRDHLPFTTEGELTGIGKYKWDDAHYEGNFQENEIHGFGKMRETDGSFYVGNYKWGSHEGKGQMYFSSNGMVYRGGFKDGKP